MGVPISGWLRCAVFFGVRGVDHLDVGCNLMVISIQIQAIDLISPDLGLGVIPIALLTICMEAESIAYPFDNDRLRFKECVIVLPSKVVFEHVGAP